MIIASINDKLTLLNMGTSDDESNFLPHTYYTEFILSPSLLGSYSSMIHGDLSNVSNYFYLCYSKIEQNTLNTLNVAIIDTGYSSITHFNGR